jgi:hypothetical protein
LARIALIRRIGEPLSSVPGEDIVPLGIVTRLLLDRRVWFIAGPQGPLTSLADRQWTDHSPAGLSKTLDWLDTVLADIRAALESN